MAITGTGNSEKPAEPRKFTSKTAAKKTVESEKKVTVAEKRQGDLATHGATNEVPATDSRDATDMPGQNMTISRDTPGTPVSPGHRSPASAAVRTEARDADIPPMQVVPKGGTTLGTDGEPIPDTIPHVKEVNAGDKPKPAPVPAGAGQTYQVQSGAQTPDTVAAHFENVTADEIRRLNGLEEGDYLQVGQHILIRAAAEEPDLSTATSLRVELPDVEKQREEDAKRSHPEFFNADGAKDNSKLVEKAVEMLEHPEPLSDEQLAAGKSPLRDENGK